METVPICPRYFFFKESSFYCWIMAELMVRVKAGRSHINKCLETEMGQIYCTRSGVGVRAEGEGRFTMPVTVHHCSPRYLQIYIFFVSDPANWNKEATSLTIEEFNSSKQIFPLGKLTF